jgi:hypothetical protein
MTRAERKSRERAKTRITMAIGVVSLALSAVPMVGCHRTPATKTGGIAVTPGAEDSLDSTREILRKGAGLNSYHNALQQLNTYFTRNNQQKPPSLTDSQRQMLIDQIGLDEEELAEVASPTFTLMDAHYLDQCFLLRDAVRSFDRADWPALQRAESAFAWLVRQVRLHEREGEVLPPNFVLRRGWGTGLERSFLFLAILQQLGIDGCMTTCRVPGDSAGQPNMRYWIPGVLIGNEIYLFDTRLGLPLPGPGGKSIATLKQARTREDLFGPFTIDAKHHYDVSPEMSRHAEIQLGWSLTALAPRMKYLEGFLGAQNKINLFIDPVLVSAKFKDAVGSQTIPVQMGAKTRGLIAAAGFLRDFLPPAEGGADQFNRKQRAEFELIPRHALPAAIRQPSYANVELVKQLVVVFAQLFTQFPLPAPRNLQIQESHNPVGIGKEPERNREDMVLRFVNSFITQQAESLAGQPLVHFSLAPKSPRDDLLRGRFDEATAKLVEGLDQVRSQKAMFSDDRELQQQLRQWCDEALAAQAEFQRARTPAEKESAQRRLQVLWAGENTLVAPVNDDRSEKAHKPAPVLLPVGLRAVLKSAAQPMGAEATYWLALCKHEQAERLQARRDRLPENKGKQSDDPIQGAWRNAAEWWKTYLDEYPAAPGAAAARLGQARALEALNQTQAAVGVLQNLSGTLTLLEETARLYRARLLQAK